MNNVVCPPIVHEIFYYAGAELNGYNGFLLLGSAFRQH